MDKGGPPRGGTVPRRRRTPPEHISARLHPASSWRRRLETRTTRNLGIPALRSPCHPSTSTGRRRLSGYRDRPPQRRVPGGTRGRATPTQASPSLGSPNWGKSPSPNWGKPASPSAASPIALGMGGLLREYAAMGTKGVFEPEGAEAYPPINLAKFPRVEGAASPLWEPFSPQRRESPAPAPVEESQRWSRSPKATTMASAAAGIAR